MFFIEVDYDDYFKNLGKIKYTGHLWKIYKPETEKSLYGMIILDPSNADVSYKACFNFTINAHFVQLKTLLKISLKQNIRKDWLEKYHNINWFNNLFLVW